ncbi:glycosyltransferase family 39 protein [Candidatus Sumerlaeota bacterium]|nr:glycosyltransferase family 39 protein [Candidatus Sumerlaeota bacterium]
MSNKKYGHILNEMGTFFPYIIFIVGAVLRIYRLGSKSLWFDEIHTLEDAFKSYNIWKQTHILYFIIVRFFLFLGKSEFCLRFASALFGALGVMIMYFAGKEIFQDKRAGILCALFTALSRVHIQYSQEARYYPAMFFLAGLSLYLFARFFHRKSLISLLLIPLVALISFMIHPTTLAFSGLLLVWIPFVLVVTPSGRSMIKSFWRFLASLALDGWRPAKAKKKRIKPSQLPYVSRIFKKILILIILICFLWSAACSGRILFRRALVYSRQIQIFNAPAQGVSPSFKFFFGDHFLVYGPIVPPCNALNKYIVGAFIIFFIIGYARALIRHFPFGGFIALSVAVTFTLLFSVPLKTWYSHKYIIFLYPGNILCLMFGFVSVVDWAYSVIKSSWRLNPLYLKIFLYSLFLAPQIYKDANLINRHYRSKGINVKDAVKCAAENMSSNDVIATYGVTHGPVQYYLNRLGVPLERYQELKWEKGDGLRSVQILLKSLEAGGAVWYIFGWPYDIEQKPVLKNWVDTHFDLVERFPYETDHDYDVTLWKWKYDGVTLNDISPVELNLPLESRQTTPISSDRLWSADATIFSLHAIESVCELAQKQDLPSSFTVDIYLDDEKAGGIYQLPMNLDSPLKTDFTVPYGIHQIRFDVKTDPPQKTMDRVAFIIQSQSPDKIFIPAVSYDASSASYDIECRSENNMTYVFMPYNSFVGYNVSIPEDGDYYLAINARNSSVGSIFYHIDIDETPGGIVRFNKADKSWETRGFPVKLKTGEHQVNIYYISDVGGKKGEQITDHDSHIQHLSLESLESARNKKDTRVSISRDALVSISGIKPLKDMKIGDEKTQGWITYALPDTSEADISVRGRRYKALKGEILPEMEKAGFSTPCIPVKPGQIAYFSVKAGVENLKNHSANVMVVMLDKNLKVVGRKWISAQGITEDVPESKFICFGTAPSQAEFMIIQLTVYENSQKRFQNPGKFWFYDFQSDADLIKNF